MGLVGEMIWGPVKSKATWCNLKFIDVQRTVGPYIHHEAAD